MQAGPPTEIPVLSNDHALASVAPRSSSLPIHPMGSSSSKHARSPAPSIASKAFPAAISLKRAFARRKKSDIDKNDSDSRSLAGFTQLKLEVTPSSASSPPQVLHPSPIRSPLQSKPAKQQLSQLASNVFSSSKKPQDTHPSNDSHRPLPPPPPPPKSAPEPPPTNTSTTITATIPPPVTTNNGSTLLARPHASASATPATLTPHPSLQPNRSSIIPMSPAIESAVNFMASNDELQQQQRAVPLSSPPSSSTNPSPDPVHPSPSSTKSDGQSTSAIPLIQGTTQLQEPTEHHPEVEEEAAVARRIERPRARSESEGVLLDREYSDKRKSDSTISHCTIRPGAGGPRSSRPVSMAESFQSTYTIVPGNGSPSLGAVVVVNKRLSAVDVDLGLLEEDDDSFKSLDEPEGCGVDTRRSSVVSVTGESKVSPTSSLLRQKRRSMSLNVGAGATTTSFKIPVNHPPPSASAAELKHPSYSISEGFYNHPPSTSSSITTSQPSQPGAWTGGGRLQPNRNQKLPAIPPHNVSPTFTYPTQRPLPNHPPPPPSFRQTAVSITSSLAPAAGLARKAVEKVKGALGHMGSTTSQHHHHHHHHSGGGGSGSISSASISSASGYSSSVSVSSTAPSAFPNEWGVLNLTRTPSNQSSAATHSSNMHAVNIEEIKKRSERERQGKKEKRGMRRTPNGQSGTYSVTSVSTSGSDPDAYMMPSGPVFGILLRGPVKKAGGIVFKRELAKCVRETAVWIGKEGNGVEKDMGGNELMGRPELKLYEKRMLPAVVVRCAQHLLIWGVQEEGLFRVPGRAAHVTKLRSEFDTGVDYDMSGCTPGDLDPHAVASIFKAFLRELPEHILTHKLSQYFDAAIEQESSVTSGGDTTLAASMNSGMRRGIGLPSGQKPTSQMSSTLASMPSSNTSSSAAFPPPNIRKPPSLSTLAMPSFNGMRPASHNLISALRSLITKLPKENRDLLRTVVELIRATAKESKLTKMPLSNLLMVFLPSLSVSAQLLRVLCEEEKIWDGLVDGELEKSEEVLDLRRDTVVLDIKRDEKEEKGATKEEERQGEDEDEDEEIDAQRRWTVVHRPEIPTVYLDSRSQASSASVASSALVSSSRDASTTESSVLHDDIFSSDKHSVRGEEEGDAGMLSSSVESVLTPLTSSAQSSMMHLGLDALDTVKDLSGNGAGPRIHVVEPVPAGVETGLMSRADAVEKEDSQPRRPVISNPLPYVSSPTPSTDKNLPQTPLSPKRRSIPGLSFPSLSAFGHRVSHGSSGSEPVSPADSSCSDRAGRNQTVGGLRTKKPSLKLLFAKKSAGSLNGSKEIVVVNTPGSAPGSAGSQVFALQQQQHSRVASLALASGGEGSGSSDSSVSTPISAVTAPGTVVGSVWGGSAGGPGSSVLELPPVLDTPIEEGPSLRLELGLDVSPPSTAGRSSPGQQQQQQQKQRQEDVKGKERVKTMVGKTPIADWYGAASSVVDLHMPGTHRDLVEDDDEDEDEDENVEVRRRTVMGRNRPPSFSSQMSMNHLGLDDDELGGDVDWTKSVLMDLELGFEGKA